MAAITGVDSGSPADRAGLCSGQTLVSVNGHPIADVLDYRFYSYDAVLTVVVKDADGTERTVRIRKAEGQDIGLTFESYLMDNQHCCENQCVFCFIDQLPPGLRRTLYFKDDDARLSFLLGQYITLTNLSKDEFERLLSQRISPLHISVHATQPALRVKLLGHPEAGQCLPMMRRLAARGIEMHAQVVVCPGLNDGPALRQTLEDLMTLHPAVASVSVVPVGLTCHREGLYPLRPFDRALAAQTVALVNEMGDTGLRDLGTRMVYAADELYLLSGTPLPDEEYYEGYPQLENGVGMMTLFEAEFMSALADVPDGACPAPFTLATGMAAAPFMRRLTAALAHRCPGMRARVQEVPNSLFGLTVDVAGLLCGRDLIAALRGKTMGDRVLIPASMLRHGGDLFLDDLTLEEVSCAVGAPAVPVAVDGGALIDVIMGETLT